MGGSCSNSFAEFLWSLWLWGSVGAGNWCRPSKANVLLYWTDFPFLTSAWSLLEMKEVKSSLPDPFQLHLLLLRASPLPCGRKQSIEPAHGWCPAQIGCVGCACARLLPDSHPCGVLHRCGSDKNDEAVSQPAPWQVFKHRLVWLSWPELLSSLFRLHPGWIDAGRHSSVSEHFGSFTVALKYFPISSIC